MRKVDTAQGDRQQGGPTRRYLTAVVVLLMMAAAGCGLTEPYLFKADEFNRDSPTFNKPRQDWEPVSICYNGIGTTDFQLQQLADSECARFGKRAQRLEDTVHRCPVLIPREAIFACVAPPG